MSGEACPMPIPATADEETIIRHLLQAKRIAVVGLADDPSRPSHYVSEYMMESGKEIIPVNPNHEQVLGIFGEIFRGQFRVPMPQIAAS